MRSLICKVPVLAAALALAASPPARAQSVEVVIAIDAGAGPRPLARMAEGRWTTTAAVVACTTEGSVERVIVTGGTIAQVPRRIAAGGDEWPAIDAAIAREFSRRQRELAIAEANLARVPIDIDGVFGVHQGEPGADIGTYYFEASRRVPDPGTAPDDDPKGTLRVAVSGWLHRQGGAVAAIGSKSELGWEEDRPDTAAARRPDLLPLAVLPHAAGWVWVMKGAAGSIRWISAYEVGASGVRTLVNAARCVAP